MTQDITTSPTANWGPFLWDPLRLAAAASDFAVDAWQRSILYADIRRQRGNQYREHLQEQTPNVLDFASEVVISGLDLPRPVNYGLVRILPPADMPADPGKRPFVVVDPRAGHGPGIGGFKPDSEIGAALQAGHSCYFVGFLPDPVPGQTIEDVMVAVTAFVREVGERHPHSQGKPAVIGNCQAGWLVLMAAAVAPELFGPLIVAGAPVSYWAGDNPMRYAGGLTGGSWLTALTGDVGAGRFDGAWLVQNFENLDPANTLWSKQYKLYADVDTEGPRYLGFEKYWGGHVFLNAVEMQCIVDDLFIGNKLATAELLTSEGVRIDLRNIRSPIVVFCSYGDNITPPPQALGWITDLYRDEKDLASHDQTIVYATHDSIGHLGIFVSGSVARKEHRKFASNIDLIDLLPAGVYEATVDAMPGGVRVPGLAGDPFLMSIRHSSVDEVRAIVRPDPQAERRFAAAARVSEINLALYRNLLQPWVRALSTPLSAQWLQALHPMRVGYENWVDAQPLARIVAGLAQHVRRQRQPVPPENPFWQAQEAFSRAVEQALDHYRDRRDGIYAEVFETLYGSPWMQALAGQSLGDTAPVRPHPGNSPEHRAFIERELARLHASLSEGALAEAMIRAIVFVLSLRGAIDERTIHYLAQFYETVFARQPFDIAAFRKLVRTQSLLMRLDADTAIAALPALLARAEADDIRAVMTMTEQLARAAKDLSGEEIERLDRILDVFSAAIGEAAGPLPRKRQPAAKPGTRRARAPAPKKPSSPPGGTKK